MSETRQILTLVGITLLMGVVAVALIGYLPSLVVGRCDTVVEEYSATFYPDGALVEEYSYTIKARRFKFLFRIWEAPLSAQSLGQPYIEPVEVEAVPGAIAYVKDFGSAVTLEEPYNEDQAIMETISSSAMSNEVGSYKPDYYDAGSYRARYAFDIHPPLEYDSESGHLNIKLASDHIPYKKVTLVFEDSDYIERLYSHPPSMRVTDEGGRIVVEGSSGKDEIIEVEMLIDLDAVQGMGGLP